MSKHIGSNFEDFLVEEGMLADAKATAIKRVLAFQLQQEMEKMHISKKALAEKMSTSRSSVDRLLDPNNPSVTLLTLEAAAEAIGKRLTISLA
ncbi:Helix-turn-helix domain-containing protein [Mariprofundus ferrinatatus]|uniref:Helix-turn-helix domain-containing protein n=2 Tax=Mariprofundus ferrinatatus TaxID=1921087 RepID=A0A2K8L3S6_9PROT|nr:XRE family transcriptional regulator [Mariprofundus ferrinatatus]ATX81985.1 Helix-turn-helix domain-containing protein [Mariprofundus ferrinatatus]